jgi:hypothetical protein
MRVPRLQSPASKAQTKKTKEGENRSETAYRAKRKVPVIKPNWTTLVKWAKKEALKWASFATSPIMAFPTNQREVQKNWETTTMGRITLMEYAVSPLYEFPVPYAMASNQLTITPVRMEME